MTTPTTYVRHTKKTEWGLGMLVDNDATYFRYFFEDGELRSFSSASLSFLAEASASAAEIEALQGLKTSRKRALGADKKKKKTISEELRGGPDSTRKVAAAAPVISTLKQQLERFSSHFPKGFEDEKYIDQERGGHGSRKIGRQGVVDLARESLAAEPLRKLMLELKGVGTANLYKKLIRLRRENPALSIGTMAIVDAGSPRVYAFTREHEGKKFLIVANLGDKHERTYGLKLPAGFADATNRAFDEIAGRAVAKFGAPLYKPASELTPREVRVIRVD